MDAMSDDPGFANATPSITPTTPAPDAGTLGVEVPASNDFENVEGSGGDF